MINGKSNILQWFEIQQKPYFRIFRKNEKESGNYVFTNTDNENETMESGRRALDRALNLISSGEFFILANDKQAVSSKGRAETFFSISMNEVAASSAPMASVAGIGGLTEADAQRIAEQKFDQMMQKQKMNDMEKQLRELKNENRQLEQRANAPMTNFLTQIQPYIGTIIEAFGIKRPVPAISGIRPDNSAIDNEIEEPAATQEDAEKAVGEFLQELSERYPEEWLGIINRLTAALKNDPEKIDMALKFL